MGLLKLLTFPVSGPLTGGKWVMQTILEQAEREHYDVASIQQQLADLETRHRVGQVGDADFERQEEALLQRLLDARDYHRRKADAT